VRLEDETGPRKHKIDKVCSISLHLRTGEIHVREIGKDMLQVLDTALGRARAALGRQISRRKRGIGQG
jgi:ribosome-associated translation inhibitor RaiA